MSRRLYMAVLERQFGPLRKIGRSTYLTNKIIIACSLGPFLVLGNMFLLTAKPEELRAVILHEQAHISMGHSLKTAFCRLFLPKSLCARVEHKHEFKADQYVKHRGLGKVLAGVLSRYPSPACATHPAVSERIARLLAV